MRSSLGYKKTEIGEIPEGWEVKTVGEVCHRPQYGFTHSARESPVGPRFLRITDIQNGVVAWDSVPYCDCTDTLAEKYLLQPGDILFARTGATTGKSFLVGECPRAVFASYPIRVRPREGILPGFLHHVFNSESYWRQVTRYMVGSAQGGVNASVLRRLIVQVPPESEQQKIASILSTVDDAIHKTDEIIAKSRQLKKGLMQQLLTKGIGHTKFQKTEIGEIPEEWEVIELVEIAVGKPQNGLYKKKEFYGFGYGIVRMTELFGDRILEVSALRRVSVDDAEIAKYSLKAGDLLFARRSLKVEGSGKCVIVPGIDETILFESSIIRLTLDHQRAVPMFYLYYLNSPLGRRSIGRVIRTVAVSGITGRDIKHLPVPLPTVAEQTRISQTLATTDKDIWRERQKKRLLEELKNGLMQVLLTGKVRVKVT